MPPQVYSRGKQGVWFERERSQLGPYFEQEHLGRALVRLDANRDGRCDVAISHLGDPAALLINDTLNAGRSTVFELKATKTARDAIGAKLAANIGGRRVVSQLTNGDGYMASNERKLHLGCGTATDVTDIQVTWPSGAVESFGALPCGQEYLLVEGTGEAVLMSQPAN